MKRILSQCKQPVEKALLKNNYSKYYLLSSKGKKGISFYPVPYHAFSTEQSAPQPNIEKKNSTNMEFKTETKKLLDIVAKSLYTDSHVFLRELLSNSSDALEKQRYLQISGKDAGLGDALQIFVTCDEAKRQIIIQDTGIGMTKEELIENLGTIAKSGSKNFVESLKKENTPNMAENIIGQFGVGFYSGFIVGDTIEVVSKSSSDPNAPAHMWVSDGNGTFEISEVNDPGFQRGTRITIHLKPEQAAFAKKAEVKKIIERYSNFINFPIVLNNERVNLVQAIWTRDKRDLTENDYKAFWEHLANTKLDYKYKLHFTTDAPLSIKSILFIPATHSEQFGMNMEEMEIHLYSKKILIKNKCRELLPNWLRFVKGIVDCEDIPLNISRENYQDSALITKLRGLLTKRIIKLLDENSKRDPEAYLTWYSNFHMFLKEGMATDQENNEQIMQLMRYSVNYTDKQVNIEDYIKNVKQGQNKIYYILGANREACERSPYMEPFKGTDIPVIFISMHVDEMVFRGLNKYKNFDFVNIETSYEEIAKDIKTTEHDKEKGLPEDDVTTFSLWIKNELQPLVTKVQISKRLRDSPAIAVSQFSSGMRQVMSMMDKGQGFDNMTNNITFEINPNHELIVKLNRMRKSDPQIASILAKQLLDNTLIANGMLNDSKSFIDRVYRLMNLVLDTKTDKVESKPEPVRETVEEDESILKKKN